MIINGKEIAREIEREIKQQIASRYDRPPCLAFILVGDHPPSQIYVHRKAEACQRVGIRSLRHQLSGNTTERELLELIAKLNSDDSIDGILVQMPLPFSAATAMSHLSPEKDVDGLHPLNVGKLLIGDRTGFIPCTPLGIQALLVRSGITLSGKHVVILGRSNLVGKPLAALLMQNSSEANATVTVLHSQSKHIKEISRSADIVVAAIGKPHYVTADMIKDGSVVIDVGINRLDHRIVGDVDFDKVQKKCSFITPVPGGVGPMTIAMLLSNTLKSYQRRQ